MNAKKANRLFLIIILLTFALIIVVNVLYLTDGLTLSLVMNNLLSELVSLLPALAFIFVEGERIFTDDGGRRAIIPFRKLRLPTVLLAVVLLIFLFPGIALCNSISMLFVDNTVLALSDQVLGEPMWKMLLSIGLFGPFVEEIVFRGVFYHSYRRSGRIIGSAVLSALCFALMHMNINQAAYAFFIGIMFALVAEATGSVGVTFLMHALFNSFEVCLMYAEDLLVDGGLSAAQELLMGDGGRGAMLDAIFMLIGPAVVCTGICIALIYLMALLEGRAGNFKGIFNRKSSAKVIQEPAMAAQPVYPGVVYPGEEPADVVYNSAEEAVSAVPQDGPTAVYTADRGGGELVTPSIVVAFVLVGIYMVYSAVAMALFS